MSGVIDFPSADQGPWHFPYHEAERVVLEGRQVPHLTALTEGDHVSLILDGRMSISVPADLGQQVAWMVANAIAIGAGYTHLAAEQKDAPFAPLVVGLSNNPIGG
jgi:hypothetical protein